MAEIARSELILGGQKSGKSRRAELLARQWLDASPAHRAVLIATALPGDEDMRERIARHQRDRALRVPAMHTVEEPQALAASLHDLSEPGTLVVIDCLALWLTNLMMPLDARQALGAEAVHTEADALCAALRAARGPMVVVSNEIGWGVIPMGQATRGFVDALGLLNQAVAEVCTRVTLMAAGLPLALKESA